MEVFNYRMVLLDEAKEFVAKMPEEARGMLFNSLWHVLCDDYNDEMFEKAEGSDNVYLLRTTLEDTEYRLFCFWDIHEDKLLVATHGMSAKVEYEHVITPIMRIKVADA